MEASLNESWHTAAGQTTPGAGKYRLSDLHPIKGNNLSTDDPDYNSYYYYYYDDANSSQLDAEHILFLLDPANHMPPGLPDAIKILFIVIFSVVILMSVTGNSLVILVVVKHQKMRTVTNAFLVSLAVSDLLVAAVTMPTQLAWYVSSEWSMGDPMCKLMRYLQGVVIVVSILTLTGIALDRYYAICHPLRARHVHTLKRAVILICTFWFGGFIVVLPLVFVHREEPFLEPVWGPNHTLIDFRTVYICAEYFPRRMWNIMFTFYIYLLLYLGPLVVVFVTYGCIVYKLWKRQPIGETICNPRDPRPDRWVQEKKRVVRMLVVIVTLFALSWFPFFTYHVYTLFKEHSAHDVRYRVALAFFQLSGYCNCCVNPVIYCFMNESFKKHFYKLLCCSTWRKWSGRRPSAGSTEMNVLAHQLSTNLTNNSTM